MPPPLPPVRPPPRPPTIPRILPNTDLVSLRVAAPVLKWMCGQNRQEDFRMKMIKFRAEDGQWSSDKFQESTHLFDDRKARIRAVDMVWSTLPKHFYRNEFTMRDGTPVPFTFEHPKFQMPANCTDLDDWPGRPSMIVLRELVPTCVNVLLPYVKNRTRTTANMTEFPYNGARYHDDAYWSDVSDSIAESRIYEFAGNFADPWQMPVPFQMQLHSICTTQPIVRWCARLCLFLNTIRAEVIMGITSSPTLLFHRFANPQTTMISH